MAALAVWLRWPNMCATCQEVGPVWYMCLVNGSFYCYMRQGRMKQNSWLGETIAYEGPSGNSAVQSSQGQGSDIQGRWGVGCLKGSKTHVDSFRDSPLSSLKCLSATFLAGPSLAILFTHPTPSLLLPSLTPFPACCPMVANIISLDDTCGWNSWHLSLAPLSLLVKGTIVHRFPGCFLYGTQPSLPFTCVLIWGLPFPFGYKHNEDTDLLCLFYKEYPGCKIMSV